MELKIPEFKHEKDLLDWLVKNESMVIAHKKSVMKKADGFFHLPLALSEFKSKADKSESIEDLLAKEYIEAQCIINSCNILDSHKDVHIKSLWDKSLKENANRMMHIQEHKIGSFDKIISDGEDLKAYAQDFTWKQLGYKAEGSTECLVFDSNVRKDRNEYMFEQYAKGRVKNHSVGMYYVKLVTCINDEDYPVQLENYEKYAPLVVNKDALEQTKYFWAVLEAKAIEGSAVPLGSNPITPTTSTKSKQKQQSKSSPIMEWLK